ncbi:unnamed protein product [Sphagnum balticum]
MGREIYSCRITDFPRPSLRHFEILHLTSSSLPVHSIPFPRLLNYPGCTPWLLRYRAPVEGSRFSGGSFPERAISSLPTWVHTPSWELSLFQEDVGNLDLGPYEVGDPLVGGLLEPESFFHEGADEVGVVASSDVKFHWLGILLDLQIAAYQGMLWFYRLRSFLDALDLHEILALKFALSGTEHWSELDLLLPPASLSEAVALTLSLYGIDL